MLPTQLPQFIAAAQEGSFSAAGRKLGISAAAVSKSIAALEDNTGVRLFHRNTRQFSLTEDGKSLYQKTLPLVTELKNCIEDLTNHHRGSEGRIRVNLPHSFAMEFVMPEIPAFLEKNPGIELDLVFDDKSLNLVEEGFDIGISNRINEDSRLVVRQLCDLQTGLFINPQYREQTGEPKNLQELEQHNCIAHRSLSSGKVMPWELYTQDRIKSHFIPKGNLTSLSDSPSGVVHPYVPAKVHGFPSSHKTESALGSYCPDAGRNSCNPPRRGLVQ